MELTKISAGLQLLHAEKDIAHNVTAVMRFGVLLRKCHLAVLHSMDS